MSNRMYHQKNRQLDAQRFVRAMLWGLSVFVYTLGAFSSEAHATVGDVISSGVTNYSSLPTLIDYLSYIAGVTVAVVGLLKIKNHFTTQNQPLGPGIWHMVGSAFLISLPTAWGMLARTLSLDAASGSTVVAANVAAVNGPMSLDQMMINFVANVKAPMGYLIWSLAAVIGLFFLVTAFLRVARNSGQDGPRSSLGAGTVGRIVIGAILLSYAATADVFSTTLFGGAGIVTFDEMQIAGVNQATLDRANDAVSAVLVFIQIIGFIAFLRGFLMLRAQADGNSSISTAAAFTHVIGGAVAFNISSALAVVQTTFCGNANCAVFFFT